MGLSGKSGDSLQQDEIELPGRRDFLGRTLGVTVSLVGVTVAAGTFAAPAAAKPAGAQATQNNWRFCQKCFAMYYWGYPTDGVCSAGGSHSAQGFNFVLPHDVPASSTAQNNWRFCQKCFAMYYWGYPTDGVCPSGGSHSAQGFNFVLPHS
ncbi:hypothetical protein E6R60_15145 [Streptomyces sp. A0642]|uniref:hypothetical protein n=1 Tax=Streptomyces sp. A0642 TaxID=2563100 RepID=UPI0010A25EBC|nr:hypothetical protein [Streptomyces sp. A0642]THA76080.1 hypothetical protein E6R60_15145 [Streptomyces sp. A0642]